MKKIVSTLFTLLFSFSCSAYAGQDNPGEIGDSGGIGDGGVGDNGGGGSGSSGAYNTSTLRVECESIDYNTEICDVPEGIVSVTLKKQYSDTRCLKNQNWFVDTASSSIRVENGCRAGFTVRLNRTVKVLDMLCESLIHSDSDYGFERCFRFVSPLSRTWVKDRHSRRKCHQYNNWGQVVNSAGIDLWVDNGCRATFSTVIE